MKYSIRDLMFVTVIVALAVAWWLDRTRLHAKAHLLQSKLRAIESLEKTIAKAAKAQAEHAIAIAAAKRALKSQQATDSEGAVRGYSLLGPQLPNFSAPAANPPKK